MADKMTMSDLRRAVMARTDATEQEMSTFYNALRDQIVAAMHTTDKQVKINGLGTFRLQAVSPRKSVNIATGEAITIEGYNKLTFTPEISIKELVYNNSLRPKPDTADTDTPSAEDQPVPAPQPAKKQPNTEFDPLKKLGEQADEIVDILATLGQGPKAKSETISTTTPTAPTPPVSSERGTTKQTPAKESVAPQPVEEIKIEPIAPKKEEKKEQKKEEKKTEYKTEEPLNPSKPKRKYHFLRDTLICVCCLLLVLVGGYIFLRETLSRWVDSLREQPATEQVAAVEPIETIDSIASIDTIATIDTTAEAAPVAYTEFIATERVRNGSRLAQIARRHYGEDKMDLWVYIYDANKDIIGNPNDIIVGTELRVPRLTEQQMDLTNPDTQAQIEQLKAQIAALGK